MLKALDTKQSATVDERPDVPASTVAGIQVDGTLPAALPGILNELITAADTPTIYEPQTVSAFTEESSSSDNEGNVDSFNATNAIRIDQDDDMASQGHSSDLLDHVQMLEAKATLARIRHEEIIF